MFSMVETRPDIGFAISIANRFAKNSSHQHTKAVKKIMRYIKGWSQQSIAYEGQDKLLDEGYSYSNWAGEKESWKSISGFIFILNNAHVSWCSKKQLPSPYDLAKRSI